MRHALLCLSLCFALGWAGSADASLQLQIEDDVKNITIEDNLGLDGDPQPGVIVFNSADLAAGDKFADWNIVVATGVSKPQIGSPLLPSMDLNVIANSTTAGVLSITLTDKNFIGTDPAIVHGFLTAIGGTTQGTVAIESFADASNADFGSDEMLTDIEDLTGVPFSAEDWSSSASTSSPNYALTLLVDVVHAGTAITSFNASMSPTMPEPGSVAVWSLFGLGAVVFGARRRRVA